jgi:hypothetical protein
MTRNSVVERRLRTLATVSVSASAWPSNYTGTSQKAGSDEFALRVAQRGTARAGTASWSRGSFRASRSGSVSMPWDIKNNRPATRAWFMGEGDPRPAGLMRRR